MPHITISYVTSTKNKLPYLRDRMEKLIAQKGVDEEILVADAGSTDGTREYLEQLQKGGHIDYLISEADHGESHALNKLFLVARGDFITLITDDDIFHFPAIQACKSFMQDHPEIDFLGTNGGFKDQNTAKTVRPLVYTENYRKWQKAHTPFSFCGLGIMFRRESLPLLGLWDPSFRRADMEYSLRITTGKANIAWYTGYSFVNVSNPQSVSLVYMKKIKDETDRLNKFYLNKNPESFFVEKLRVLKNKLRSGSLSAGKKKDEHQADWPSLVRISETWLEEMNRDTKTEFLWNKKQ